MSECYFAYGSNLWMEQVVDRTGPIGRGHDRPRLARLPNYRLVFNMRGGRNQFFANIMPGGDTVIGVVYHLSPRSLERMDQFERGYIRERVRVWVENESIEAFTYIAKPANVADEGRPSAAYLGRILRGAREHGLPEEYIRCLQVYLDDNTLN